MAAKHFRFGRLSAAAIGSIIAGACAPAGAAVVTYRLSYDDDGFGNTTPGSFAVYASDSADNSGIFAIGVDLTGTLDTIFNLLPAAQYRKTGSPTKFLGFSAGVTEDVATAKLSGLPDLAKGTNLIPIYGFGQTGGNLCPGPGVGSQPVGYTCVDGNSNSPGFLYSASLLVGTGTYSGARPHFQVGSPDNKASVYTGNTGTTNAVAQVLLNEGGVSIGDTVTLTASASDTNQAVDGAIAVSGGNGNYVSEVDQLLNNVNHGSAPIETIGDEAGSVYVMARLTGGGVDTSVVAGLGVDSSDPQFAPLHANYDSQFGPSGFNALFKFDNIAGPKVFNWNFPLHPGVNVDQLAVVPEPTTLGLMGLAGLGLLARRRHR